MNEWPPTTTPSTGTRPPGRTRTTSPARSSAKLADCTPSGRRISTSGGPAIPATWPDQDHIPGAQFGQAGGLYAVRAPNFHLLGQEIQEILNCTAAAADREVLKDLGDQDEEH